jgi:hypothetical protein
VSARQPSAAHRDQHRHQDRQLLRDRREREREAGQQHLLDRLPAHHTNQRHQDAGRDRQHQRRARELAHGRL